MQNILIILPFVVLIVFLVYYFYNLRNPNSLNKNPTSNSVSISDPAPNSTEKSTKKHSRNLIYLIQDVSKSLIKPYKDLYSILNKESINYTALLNFIEVYSDLNKTDILTRMVGTKKVKSFDLIQFLKQLDLNINENEIKEKIDNYEKQPKYECDDPDTSLKNIYNGYDIKPDDLDTFLKKFPIKKKCVLFYYAKKDGEFRNKVYKYIKAHCEDYNSKFFLIRWFFYSFKFPEDLIKETIRLDMESLIIRRKNRIEKYQGNNTINNVDSIYEIIKSNKDNKETILSLLNDCVGGEVNLEEVLTEAYEIIESKNKSYKNKIILLITDGNSKGKSLKKISEKIKNELKAKIIVFFISSHDLKSPKEFFSNPIDDFSDKEVDLFNASSYLDSKYFSFFRHKKFIVPFDAKIKLFIQGNDKDIIKVFIESFKNFINNNELLFNIIAKKELKQYINSTVHDFEAKKQKDDACYAYASATAIHMTLLRLYGNYTQSFENIKNNLIYEYSKKGANLENVLDKHLSNFTLKYKIVNEKEAKEAVYNNRVCIANFQMSNLDFLKIKTFFENNKAGILIEKLLDKTNPNPIYLKNKSEKYLNNRKNHAVVLISSTNQYLTFLNSLGTDFGNFPFFKIDNSKALKDVKFYEIYYNYNELSAENKKKHKKFRKELTYKYFDNYENYEKLCKMEIQCPLCKKNSKIEDFNSEGSLDQCLCPNCKVTFDVKNENLLQKLYFDFITK